MKASVETRAGVLFAAVVLLVAAGGLAWYLAKASRYATYEIRTPDPVSGLIADSPVEFHGVEVGRVTRVALADAHSVRVLLEVRKEAPLNASTVATITGRGLATRGFTGYVYVALENVGTDTRPLAAPEGRPHPIIPTGPSRSASLDTAISQLGRNVQVLTDLVASTLDPDTVAALKESVGDLQRVSRTLADNNEKFGRTLANAERASGRLQPLLQSSQDTVRTMQNQVLPQAYRTLARLDDVSRSLDELTTRIQRNPAVLVRGASPLPPGPGEAER